MLLCFNCKSIQHVGKIFSSCRVSIASAIIQPLKVTPFFHPLSWLSFQKWVSRCYFLHRWCKLFLPNFLIEWVHFSKIHFDVVTFSHVYTQLILFSFSDFQCKIIRSCFCHQLYLARRNWTLDTIMLSCYFNKKGNLSSAYGNYQCHYWLQFFSFSDQS